MRPSVQEQISSILQSPVETPKSDSSVSVQRGFASGYRGVTASSSKPRPLSSGAAASMNHHLTTTSASEITAFQQSVEVIEPRPSEMRDDISSISSSISLAASCGGTSMTDQAFLSTTSKRVRVPDFLQSPHLIVSTSQMSPSSLRAAKSSNLSVTYTSPRAILPISNALKQERINSKPQMSSDLTKSLDSSLGPTFTYVQLSHSAQHHFSSRSTDSFH